MDTEKLPPDRGPPSSMELDSQIDDLSVNINFNGDLHSSDTNSQSNQGSVSESLHGIVEDSSGSIGILSNSVQLAGSILTNDNKQGSEVKITSHKSAVRTTKTTLDNDNHEDIDNNKQRFDELAKNKYRMTDSGPFYVFVEHSSKNLGRLFPIKVGHFLYQSEEFRKSIKDIEAIGINRVKIILDTYSMANKLVDHPILIQNNLRSYIPKHFTQKKGLIRMVDTTFDDKYLWDTIKSDLEIVDIKRLRRKVTDRETGKDIYVDRQMVLLTFLGSSIPDKIRINFCTFPVEPWVHPVIRCFRCLRFGHVADQCKGNVRCSQCGALGHNFQKCIAESPYCIYCQDNSHHSASKKCPAYIRQHNIKKIMAAENVSFKDAQFIADNPSYAKVSTHNRFAVLNNDENFPELPRRNEQVAENTFLLRKPKINRPVQSVTAKKRKTSEISPTPLSPSIELIDSFERGAFSRDRRPSSTPRSQPIQHLPLTQYTQQHNSRISGSQFTQSQSRQSYLHTDDYERIRDQILREVSRHFETLMRKLVPEDVYNNSETREDINKFFSSLLNQSSNKLNVKVRSES